MNILKTRLYGSLKNELTIIEYSFLPVQGDKK